MTWCLDFYLNILNKWKQVNVKEAKGEMENLINVKALEQPCGSRSQSCLHTGINQVTKQNSDAWVPEYRSWVQPGDWEF